MPWPSRIVRQFEKVPLNPSDADFAGQYNKILHILFPVDTDFSVVPRYAPASRESADVSVIFEVQFGENPVFILGLKSPRELQYRSTREAADRQVRTRLLDLREYCPLSALHAVSAMGSRLCFYQKPQDGPMQPSYIQAKPELQTDAAPRELWDCDILEVEGFRRFQAIAEEIKRGCAAL